MNTTIKQQIKAVQAAMEKYPSSNKENVNSKRALNDAASTLAAVNMIGEDKIKALPDLIKACEGVLFVYKDMIPGIYTLQKLEKIIIQLKK